ncbi:hypothetical protein N0V83_003689 [Neocucurbitaria cava]|uniref:Uncharacterized protein n=1 Tax=Neocucurbitaria cava TaxID=798079 RepID=A0A9W9CNQ5_9PLEO|nr:hypothetical protein N0V83_003689 [Neocucurbitaria cava]
MMTSQGELLKRMSIICAEAKALGYKIQEVMPEEVQHQFHEMKELQAAQDYIKEVEGREQDLLARNKELLAKLTAKEAEHAIELEDFAALKVDLQQAQHGIDFHKEIADNATERAERYQRKLADVIEKQVKADEAGFEIDRLQAALRDQQVAYLSLSKENAKANELADQRRKQDQKMLDEKDKQIAALTCHAKSIETESDQFSETLTALVDALESEHSSATAAVNDKATLLCQTEKVYSAIVSEITPLRKFYDRTFAILAIYQSLFRTLSDPFNDSIKELPDSLDTLMSGAANDLYLYEQVHQALQTGNIAEEHVRVQLEGIAGIAGRIYKSLECINGDVAGFLSRLRREPDAWWEMKGKFALGVGKKMKRFSLG